MHDPEKSTIPSHIQRLMPDASEADQQKATAAFDEYMAVVWEIVDRLSRERESDSPNLGKCDRFEGTLHSI